ncbi:hypothetical protein, partial [Bradyrhizobium sp.]|uniref:hypothetical protein n=1 Tax=Bradyrhizobium sp. TaxID=376 RepID=UPI0025BDA573
REQEKAVRLINPLAFFDKVRCQVGDRLAQLRAAVDLSLNQTRRGYTKSLVRRDISRMGTSI